MGSGGYDKASYFRSSDARTSAGLPDFGHDHDVRTGKKSGVHPDLDPAKVAGPSSPLAGKPVREARDSDEHPESVPVVVFFDVTGSMGTIPVTLQKKLNNLIEALRDRAGLEHVQLLVGAVGDATCDRFPLQVGQFESDNRIDEQLRGLILEGGGGGQHFESYGLAHYFLANYAVTDAWEKRGKKGYAITIGDEAPWPVVEGLQVAQLFGLAETPASAPLEDVLKAATERWEVFHLHAQDGSYRDKPIVIDPWRALLGERLVLLEDSALACEVIAGLIHSHEVAHATLDDVVAAVGATGFDAEKVKKALVPFAGKSAGTGLAVAEGELPEGHAGL